MSSGKSCWCRCTFSSASGVVPASSTRPSSSFSTPWSVRCSCWSGFWRSTSTTRAGSKPSVSRVSAMLPTFSIPHLYTIAPQVPPELQFWIFLAFFVGFAIKVPMFPFHTWLPDAHVEAPTAGSVILAGVLLKMGTYGFVRLSLPLLPDATVKAVPWVGALSIIAIVYGALVAMAQKDMKKLVAYSSVCSHGFHHARDVRPQRSGSARRDSADAQPRGFHRRPLPPGRHRLRAAPQQAHLGVRWDRQGHAGLCDLLFDHHHVVHRPADPQRFHR